MKLVVEIFATFMLIYWPAALMAVRAGIEDGEAARARLASVVAPAILFLPALVGALFYWQNWSFLWLSARTFFIAVLVLPPIVGALLGFPRALFAPRSVAGGYTVRRRTVYYSGRPLQDVDSITFETLSPRIARDRSHVFRGPDILIGADAASFEILGESGYARDVRRVYYFERAIPGADPASFQVRPEAHSGIPLPYDASDEYRRYQRGKPL
jgi:hypothetical protein